MQLDHFIKPIQFDPFVIPFNIGLYFIMLYIVFRNIMWFRDLSRPDKLRLQRGFFGKAFGQSIKEIFMESLLHRKIFKTNIRLWYMHTSLAFGWFLLILFGTIEADIFGSRHLNAPYKAIFFKFFNPEHGRTGIEAVYSFLMDLILTIILSGLILAVTKRFFSGVVGMKSTTKLKATDRIALISLWLIFPSRLLAESFTSGASGSGSFLTGTLGDWLVTFLPASKMTYPFWWMYSLSLGTFFVLLPLTRYMHIPTELFHIFMKNSGIKTGNIAGSASEVQVHSCSSCGICIDACQMNFSAGINNIQATYLMKAIRNNENISDISFNCMVCGRCDVKCPVGIELSPIRMIHRRINEPENEFSITYKGYFRKHMPAMAEKISGINNFNFLPEGVNVKADVIFFAGCMTHLTPSIIKSMVRIMDASGLSYNFIDEKGGVCCGRPLMLAGQDKEARELINYNSQLIWKTGARMLVTSCPICYKVFKESYYLDVKVLHHSEFIKYLIDYSYIRLNFLHKKIVYHTPCDLGRGSGIYNAPKEVLQHIATLELTKYEDENSLCCGGSLGNIKMSSRNKQKIAIETAARLTAEKPDMLATSCPLCKKTIAAATETKVADLSEIVAEALSETHSKKRHATTITATNMLVNM